MFSPATRKSKYNALKGRNATERPPDSSPITPFGDNQIANRPKSGTPAPWVSRLSVVARLPSVKRSERMDDGDPIHPVYVGEFPQVVRDEQMNLLMNHVPGQVCIAGGMDKATALSWMIFGNRLFLWSYLPPASSNKCVIVDIPSNVSQISNVNRNSHLGSSWLLCAISWDDVHRNSSTMLGQLKSAGVLLCNQKSRAIIYWPDIYSAGGASPITSLESPEESGVWSPEHGWSPLNGKQRLSRHESTLTESSSFNSLIASAVPENHHTCIALAGSSNGELWQFNCSPTGIHRRKVYDGVLGSPSAGTDSGQLKGSKGYPRSLIWRSPFSSLGESKRQFFLLTDHEIQCYSVELSFTFQVSRLWSHEIIGTDGDLGIKKDLAGQKRIWPLDVQVDDHGKEITILVATFCKDRVSSSSYTRYSLLTMQHRSGMDSLSSVDLMHETVLEKKAPVQVIIPKARVEEEEFLFSMRLRTGGKPSGSAVILSGDGTATVSYYWRNSTRLYQFDLPYDAGKVLDASVFPSLDDNEEGAWVVLTEKAGVWAIPEKAVLLGGVEPPERSLSRKGSSKEGSTEDGRRNLTQVSGDAAIRVSSEAGITADRDKASGGNALRTAQDDEAEALISHIFHDFLSCGQVDGSLERLIKSGAFERDGEMNAFARVSKSIVDTLAKHWTTTRGAEIVALAVVSNQLTEKVQKHQKFLQFLAVSKCHEQLCSKQRHALQIIMEHGEKLAAMIQLRELQNMLGQSCSTGVSSKHSGSESNISGSLWNLIQIVGERARRNTVLLMDRDNAEVFYSKVSDLEDVFYCLDKHLDYIISREQPIKVQVQRACELSNTFATIIHSCMHYKNEHHMWYPPPDGLMPWYSQSVVRCGLWTLASLMIQLLKEYEIDLSDKSDVCSHLEVLADIMLEAYVGAITAKIEREEGHKGLVEEYWSRRDALLDSLYQQIKVFVEAQLQDAVEETQETKDVILRKLSSNLLSIGRRHEGYRTLWNICCDLNDSVLLKTLMHQSVGPKGGFSYFVFERLHEDRQFSKLLRLGEEFPEELAIFLKDHLDLLWLHEIFLHRFSSASKTLHVLALCEDGNSIPETDEEIELGYEEAKLTLPERKQLLYLSKIAAVSAGKDADYRTEIERIDADLKILKSQEEILELLPDDEEKQKIRKRLLPPGDLIRLCLKGQTVELSLKAFDVFAWTSSSFRKCNRTLLEECWKNAVDQDDWEKLYEISIVEGWSDEDALLALEKTVLFQASQRCYGPESESFEGGFDEVLPLRLEGMELPNLKDSASSVEAILMQHKDFADAGKLMLTAVMLGSAQVDIGGQDGLVVME